VTGASVHQGFDDFDEEDSAEAQARRALHRRVVWERVELIRAGNWAPSRNPDDYLPEDAWKALASCAALPVDAMFPERGEDQRAIRALCGLCPVAEECLSYAVDAAIKFGVWGGASERRRRVLRHLRGDRDDLAKDTGLPEEPAA